MAYQPQAPRAQIGVSLADALLAQALRPRQIQNWQQGLGQLGEAALGAFAKYKAEGNLTEAQSKDREAAMQAIGQAFPDAAPMMQGLADVPGVEPGSVAGALMAQKMKQLYPDAAKMGKPVPVMQGGKQVYAFPTATGEMKPTEFEVPQKPGAVKTVTTGEGVFTMNPDGSLGKRLGSPNRAVVPQSDGPFAGKAMDAQVYNILLTGDPASPEYALAYREATQPRIIQTPNGMMAIEPNPLPPGIKPPVGMDTAPAAPGVPGQPGAQPAPQPAVPGVIPGTEPRPNLGPGMELGPDGKARPIPGTPQEAEAKQRNEATQGAIAATQKSIETAQRLLTHPGRSGATGAMNLGQYIPGTASKDFAADLQTLKSQTFLPAVKQLAGMGALSNAEGAKLEAAIGALDPSMSEEGFQASLQRIIADLEGAKARMGGAAGGSVKSKYQDLGLE